VRAVERLAKTGERFDVVVLDPPRAGAADLIALLPRLAPARIVYVSCDPMTLARDLGTLSKLGYATQTAWPVDMMPQTWHVEVVALVTPVANRP
jgi:23S rRNA (uracil1939-C5)-methyltransferase